MELAEWSVPCGPALPVISANVRASEAAASSDRDTAGGVCSFAFASASRSKGWIRLGVGAPTVDSEGDTTVLRCWFGDDETVVADVLAVRGRSAMACDMTWPDVAGILPPSSIRRILDLSSSNSSHTETAGPVEPWDSVPSARDDVSCGAVSICGVLVSSREDE
jgi:hypothetical protein